MKSNHRRPTGNMQIPAINLLREFSESRANISITMAIPTGINARKIFQATQYGLIPTCSRPNISDFMPPLI
jgi:hypothetical protein